MTKLEVKDSGKLFIWAMNVSLHWLSIGGEIKLKTGHTLVMDELARPGFLADSYDTETKETKQVYSPKTARN
jgi:hypothetical protein